MNTFLTIAPYLALAAIGLITLFRTTNALIAAEAARMVDEQQRASARKLKRAWITKQKTGSAAMRVRRDLYAVQGAVMGSRRGVEL